MRAWEWVFLLALGAGIVGAAWIFADRRHLTFDEILTSIVVSEPSLPRMLEAIGTGVETNPPLFFILEWTMAQLFGRGDFALRAISALSVALSAAVLYATVRNVTGPRVGILAVAAVIGLSRDVFEFSTWARYYGWMMLVAATVAWAFVRCEREQWPRTGNLALVFLAHCTLIYTHLFGLFFSGMTLVAHVALDWLGGRALRWQLYAMIGAAWATFSFWGPKLPAQLSVTKDGTFTPRFDVGTFFTQLEMQIPLAIVLLLLGGHALLARLATRPAAAALEAEEAAARGPHEATALLALGLSWMAVPVATWAASQVRQPFYMPRYVAPCIDAWVLLLAAAALALHRLPRSPATDRLRLPRWVVDAAWAGALIFCIAWQPLRAWTEPPKPLLPFTDADHGHTTLPIVFEDPMDFFPRAVYGTGREYALLLDRDAAAASDGYYTKLNFNYFSRWKPYHPEIAIRFFDELPAWPDGFLAVDDPLSRTLDWIFQNKPGLKVERLGQWDAVRTVFRVRREATP